MQQKQNNMRKILIVVDVQKDFYHPDGALYVKGGELLPEKLSKIMPQFDDIVFTLDYHPYNHCSFNDNGGTWPVHCVKGTEGSSLPNEFLPFLVEDSDFVYKGEFCDAEEYGANAHDLAFSISWESIHDDDYLIVFCGIAGDYCVKETINNFIETFPADKHKVRVYLDGIASIDDGATIKNYIRENCIEEWKPQE